MILHDLILVFIYAPVICNHAPLLTRAGDSRANVLCFYFSIVSIERGNVKDLIYLGKHGSARRTVKVPAVL